MTRPFSLPILTFAIKSISRLSNLILDGIFIFDKDKQPLKAFVPIYFKFDVNENWDKEEHFSNEFLPIYFWKWNRK